MKTCPTCERELSEVCDSCGQGKCWQGDFMCEGAKAAGMKRVCLYCENRKQEVYQRIEATEEMGKRLTPKTFRSTHEKVEMYNQNSIVEPPRCWYGTWGHGHYCQCGRSLVRHYSKMWGTAEECRKFMADRWGQKWCTTVDGGSGEYTQRPAWFNKFSMTLLPQRCHEGKCGQEKNLGLDASGNENF